MAKKVTIEVDTDASALAVEEGRLFLGTEPQIILDGWTNDTNCRPVITLFIIGTKTPVASSSYETPAGATDPVLKLNLAGATLRKAFHEEAARHAFVAYLNQQKTTDGGSTWNYLPDVEAEGNLWIEWSPETFDVDDDDETAMAALQGPRGTDGADGKSAYTLACENGYTGTLQQWLKVNDVRYALTGKTFEFSGANSRKFADAIKTIFEILGGTVS